MDFILSMLVTISYLSALGFISKRSLIWLEFIYSFHIGLLLKPINSRVL